MTSIHRSAARRCLLWPAPLVLGMYLLIGSSTGCSSHAPVPEGYDRIDAAGGDLLYAKPTHEKGGEYAEVIVRAENGETLCDARGPLMTTERMPAVCEDSSLDTFTYVTQVPRPQPDPRLCRPGSGEPVATTRLRTDSTWPVDFLVVVHRSAELTSVAPCDSFDPGD